MIIKNAQAGLMLQGCIVTSLNVKNDLAIPPTLLETPPIIDMDYDIYQIDENSDGIYFGSMTLTTKVTYKQGRKAVFTITMVLDGVFAAPKSVCENVDDFKKKLKVNGLTSLISVARANISTLTSNIFFSGCIKLPMINVFKLIKQKEEQNK